MHHFGIAADIVFLNGKNPSWDSKNNWQRLGTMGQTLGLEWGGSWKSFNDRPHFQLIPATVSAQAKIINKNYPVSGANIDMTNAFALYKQSQSDSFSVSSIDKLWSELNKDADQKIINVQQTPKTQLVIFTRDLYEGMKGQDVKMLQKILNSDVSTQVASQGIGSMGQESDYFGGLTKKAVQKFQIKYGIISQGDQGYGVVGISTRKKLEGVYSA